MRIAVISTMGGSPWGGSEELWADMAGEALKAGHSVALSVYCWPTSPLKIRELEGKGARVLRRPFPRRRSRLGRLLKRAIGETQGSFREVFDFAPDVIFVNQGATYDVPDDHPGLAQALYTSGIPYVVMCHFNTDALHLGEALRSGAGEFFERAFKVAFVSEPNRRTTERQLARCLPNNILLRNPVNLTDLTAVPWPSATPARFATVARLDVPHKGQDILFESLASEVWRGRDWRLRVYGDGPDKGYLQLLAALYGIADRVEFAGHVMDVRTIWADNHVLVMPSRAEGTPLALVEAMICGRPCVATDVGGISEWLEEGRAGLVAPAPSARALSAALERLWSCQADWQRMGSQAHEDAVSRFDRSPGQTLLGVLATAAASAPKGLLSAPAAVVPS